MKRLLLALCLFFCFPLAAAAASGVAHDLRLVLDPAAGRLIATDRLTLPAAAGPFVELQLAPRAEVTAVLLTGKSLPFSHKGDVLRIGPLPRHDSLLTLEIRYHGHFADPVPVAPLNNEDPSYGVAAAITPSGTFLSGGAGWYPGPSEGTANFRIRVEAPPGVWAVTAGKLVNRGESAAGTFIVWETQHPLPDLTLAAGRYRIAEDLSGPVPIYTFFTAAHADLAKIYLQSARADLARYQKLFGPYPFAKFAVVENFFPTGYGFPSWTLLGSSIVPLPFIVTTSLSHEIAHSWWGNGVRVDYRYGNWCEGLATYVADYLLKELQSATAARDYRLKILRDYATLVPPGAGYPLSRFTSRRSRIDQAIGYGKSAMVFHMARRRVGDAAFWAGLRRVARTRMFQEASWDDFARALDPTGKLGMLAFFDQWVKRPGAPVLKLTAVELAVEDSHRQVRGRIEQQAPDFTLDLPLHLETADGPRDGKLHLQGAAASFQLPASARPLRLLVDPDAEVFRRLATEEVPATVNTLRGSSNLLVVVAAHTSPAVRKAARDLLIGLGRQARWVKEADLDPRQAAGHDLLLVGWPDRQELRPPLPAPLRIESGRFLLDGKSFTAPRDVLFAELPQPLDSARHAGLFLPLGDDGAEIAARKIPHYGTYSYLAFSAGHNRVKGTWPVTRSPLIHTWESPRSSP